MTFFIWEGMSMDIDETTVKETLDFVVRYSGKGSVFIFDYYLSCIIDGSCTCPEAMNVKKWTESAGERLRFGIDPPDIIGLMKLSGFSNISAVSSRQCKRLYFTGVNRHRPVTDIMNFVYVSVV